MKTIFTTGIGNSPKKLVADLQSHNIDLVLDIRTDKIVLPKSRGPSKDSHKYMNYTITKAGMKYRWVMSLSNNFGRLETKYSEWIKDDSTQKLLKSIAQGIVKQGVSNLCIMCDEEDTRVCAAIALQVELNKVNGGWGLKHLQGGSI